MKKKARYLIPTISLVVFGLFLAFNGSKDVDTNYVIREQEKEKSNPHVPLGQGLHDGVEAGRPSPENSDRSIVAELEASRDYRVFYTSLLSSGIEKAALYARHVLTLCQALRHSDIGRESASSTKQEEARQLIVDRCANFTDEEIAASSRLAIDKDRRLNGGLSDLLRTWMDASSDSIQRQQILKKILATDDPLLLEYVGPGLYARNGQGVGFAGKIYSGENDVWVFGSAWLAAACDGAQTACGRGDRFVVEECARSGLCAENRTEMLRQLNARRFGKEGSALFEKIYPSFVSAIRTRNVGAFSD